MLQRLSLVTAMSRILNAVEKIPKMETFVRLLNVLELSADEALQDSLAVQYKIKASELEKKISELTPQQRKLVLDVLDVMLQNM